MMDSFDLDFDDIHEKFFGKFWSIFIFTAKISWYYIIYNQKAAAQNMNVY